jgi:hypothetical protein
LPDNKLILGYYLAGYDIQCIPKCHTQNRDLKKEMMIVQRHNYIFLAKTGFLPIANNVKVHFRIFEEDRIILFVVFVLEELFQN